MKYIIKSKREPDGVALYLTRSPIGAVFTNSASKYPTSIMVYSNKKAADEANGVVCGIVEPFDEEKVKGD